MIAKRQPSPLVIIAKLNAPLLKINVCAISHPVSHVALKTTPEHLTPLIMFNSCKCCGHSVSIDRRMKDHLGIK